VIGLALKHHFNLPPLDEEEDEAIGRASFLLGLRSRGIRDTAVLRAMEKVPRELFAPARFGDLSRKDVALPLPCGQTMTAPATVATMLAALCLEPGQRVLEIGTGSGYVTALLAAMGAEVVSVERCAMLADSAVQHVKVAGLVGRARIEVGDGLAQRVRERFDRVIVNGASTELPQTLTALLAPGGRLVGALTANGFPRLLKVERGHDGGLRQEFGAALRIAPLTAGKAASL
jgi:protein-L-isoaspartate(D-aspartate) O-methyltransferase